MNDSEMIQATATLMAGVMANSNYRAKPCDPDLIKDCIEAVRMIRNRVERAPE